MVELRTSERKVQGLSKTLFKGPKVLVNTQEVVTLSQND